GSPEFNVTTRGLVYFHLEVRTGSRDLHSGLFGGAALNALHALNQILAAVLVRDGVLPEPLREGVVPPTDEEVAAWAELVPGSQMLAGSGGRKSHARADEEFYLRTTSEPSLDVNGIAGGSAVLQKTVLPAVAEANLSIRLAPGQDVETIASALQRLLREAPPQGAGAPPTRLSPAAPRPLPPDAPLLPPPPPPSSP